MTNKKKEQPRRAVALGYEPEQHKSPKVIGKGNGFVAEEIIRLAQEQQIPIQEDPTLVQLLTEIEINQEIPEELYEVVAEIFAFIYQIDQGVK